MKCLITADLHYSLKQYDWLLREAPKFDIVILAGDHLNIASHVDGRAQSIVVLKYLEQLRSMTQLFTCSGNHDLDGRNADGERVAKWFGKIRALGIAADGDCIEADGMLFSMFPWWDGDGTRDAVAAQLARDAARRQGSWAWIYHAPPAGSPTSWAGKRSFGDDSLTAWIGEYEPDFVFSGHVHSSPFADGGSWIDRIGPTWVFNAGYEMAPTPPHVILSTDESAAVWLSTSFGETARLDGSFANPAPRLTELPAWV
jgi:Icc-related predicted phosphoesterase